MTRNKSIVLVLLFVGCVVLALSGPSERDIKACKASTGWTYQHCKMELSR